VRSLVRVLLPWFRANARDLPWRRTRDPYAIWVSEIMLQQTQVATVVPYYERWMKAMPTVQSLSRASSQRLHKLWEGLGYYTRVRNLQKAARHICTEHGGRFPECFEDVLALPGIGRYTAGAICSIAFNRPTPILDGNVVRVLTRVFGIGGNPREVETNARLWQLAEVLVHEAERGWTVTEGVGARSNNEGEAPNCSHFNQSLMELGATVCTPRRPECAVCPVRRLCVARREHRTDALPALSSRTGSVVRTFRVFAAQRNGKVWAVQQPLASWNGGLWEFPSTELSARKARSLKGDAEQALGMAVRRTRFIDTLRHSITRYRLTLEVHLCMVSVGAAPIAKHSGRWLAPRELLALPFSAAHRRICDTLLKEPLISSRHDSAHR